MVGGTSDSGSKALCHWARPRHGVRRRTARVRRWRHAPYTANLVAHDVPWLLLALSMVGLSRPCIMVKPQQSIVSHEVSACSSLNSFQHCDAQAKSSSASWCGGASCTLGGAEETITRACRSLFSSSPQRLQLATPFHNDQRQLPLPSRFRSNGCSHLASRDDSPQGLMRHAALTALILSCPPSSRMIPIACDLMQSMQQHNISCKWEYVDS